MAQTDHIPCFPLDEASAKEEIKNAIYLVTGIHILEAEAEGILHLYKKHLRQMSFIPILAYIESLYGAAKR